jgi:transcription factor AP-2, invertebrate
MREKFLSHSMLSRAKIESKNNETVFFIQERLTSHGGGIGLASGSPAYSSGGRASSNQHGHGPASHQPADFQPPYFPPPFHHPSTHQSPPQQQQQVSKQNSKPETSASTFSISYQNHHGLDYLNPANDPYGQTPLSSGLHHHTTSLHHHYNQLAGLSRPSQEQLGLTSRSHRDSVDLVQGCHVVSPKINIREFNNH